MVRMINTGGFMAHDNKHAPQITTHINASHAKPNIFEGEKNENPKINKSFKNGENTGSCK